MSYKFIFDNSILDQLNVEKLRQSRIKDFCFSGKFSFYMTPALLKEFLHFIPQGKIPDQLVSTLDFILSLQWQKTCNEVSGPDGIYAMEFSGKLPNEYLFVSDLTIKQTLQDLRNGEEFSDNMKKEVEEYNNNWRKSKIKSRRIYCEIRDNVKYTNNYSFQDYLRDKFEKIAISKIEKSIASQKPKEELIEFWRTHKQACPHFNKFVEGEMYVVWYAYEHKGNQAKDSPIDTNAQDDIEYLVYLNDVDCIVSNDSSFMKKASKTLFSKKDYLSVDEFIKKMDRGTS